jgi:hypothetical protein
MDRDQILELLAHSKPSLVERFGVTDLALFGSIARGATGQRRRHPRLLRLPRNVRSLLRCPVLLGRPPRPSGGPGNREGPAPGAAAVRRKRGYPCLRRTAGGINTFILIYNSRTSSGGRGRPVRPSSLCCTRGEVQSRRSWPKLRALSGVFGDLSDNRAQLLASLRLPLDAVRGFFPRHCRRLGSHDGRRLLPGWCGSSFIRASSRQARSRPSRRRWLRPFRP